MEQNSLKTQRVRQVDLAKTAAIVCVVLIHVSSGPLLREDPDTARWMQSLFWGSASRFAVPLFFLCSGTLLLDENRSLTVRHIWTRSIPHLLITLFFWAAAYVVAPFVYRWNFDWSAIGKGLRDVLLWHHEQHLYFLHIMLLVYAALPLTRSFLHRLDEKTLRYALVFWLVTGSLLPTLKSLGLFFASGIPAQWPLSMTWSAIGCTALGWFLRKKPLRVRTSIMCVLLGFAICYGGTAALSLQKGALSSQLLGGMSPGPLLMATGVFCLCGSISPKLPKLLQKGAEAGGKASFGIYLAHKFVLSAFHVFGVTTCFAPPLLSIPALAAVCILSTFAGVFVLSKIPVVKRWLV